MATGLGWVDFSKEHRDRVFSVIDLLGEGGTVDELGIGVIRDAIAERLFPGVSTIQTRPKYFILIPQLIQKYVSAYRTGAEVPALTAWLRTQENLLMHELAESYHHEVNNGVIGIHVAKNKGELARKASSVYWNGIRVHGIVGTYYSLNDYLVKNNLAGMVRTSSSGEQQDDTDVSPELDGFQLNLSTFPPAEGKLKLDLSAAEAHYLRDQFRSDQPGKKWPDNLFKHLVVPPLDRLARDMADFPTLGAYLLEQGTLPEATLRMVKLGLDFDFLIHGAHIRYNILLHQQSGVADFSLAWQAWLEDLENRRHALETFDLPYLFREVAPQTKAMTKGFITAWYREVMNPVADTAKLDHLVRNQEMSNKNNKSKFRLQSGEYTDWVGIQKLDYRFPRVQTIIKDITNAFAHA